MMKHSLEEKLSALYDGELDTNEVDEILRCARERIQTYKKNYPNMH